MYRLLTFCVLLFVHFSQQSSTSTPSASVELNEKSFYKFLKKFEVAVVKFDVAFPYGEKHDQYVAFANDAVDVDDLLVAEVGVKDYGDRDNVKFASSYGAIKENFPVVKLFVKSQLVPVELPQSEFTTDGLKRFLAEHTDLLFTMPGCIPEFDLLARQFIKANKDEKLKILKEVEEKQEELKEENEISGNIYKMIMERVLEKGDSFTTSEINRLKRLLHNKISEQKKKEISIKLNILRNFLTNNEKDEL